MGAIIGAIAGLVLALGIVIFWGGLAIFGVPAPTPDHLTGLAMMLGPVGAVVGLVLEMCFD